MADQTEHVFGLNPCLSLKTGQTTSYETGDDGDLELGISKSYTVNVSGTTTNITINGKTHALSDDTVIDNRTGLMWARYVPAADIGPGNDGKLHWKDTVNAEDIWSAVAQANANSLGGYADWRVPNYLELPSIVNLGNSNPCIDTTVFPSTPTSYHWTSSTRPDDSDYAFIVIFSNGRVDGGNNQTSKYYVRLVRG